MAFQIDQIPVPAVTQAGVSQHFFTLSGKMLGEVQAVGRSHLLPRVGFVIHNYYTSLHCSTLAIKDADKW